jgi:hypothetical protein
MSLLPVNYSDENRVSIKIFKFVIISQARDYSILLAVRYGRGDLTLWFEMKGGPVTAAGPPEMNLKYAFLVDQTIQRRPLFDQGHLHDPGLIADREFVEIDA